MNRGGVNVEILVCYIIFGPEKDIKMMQSRQTKIEEKVMKIIEHCMSWFSNLHIVS